MEENVVLELKESNIWNTFVLGDSDIQVGYVVR